MKTATIKKNTSTIELLYSRKDFKKYNLKRYFRVKTSFQKENTNETTRTIKGYASTIHKDRVDDIITLEALKKAKNDLLQDGSKTVFYNHDRSMPIGVTRKTLVDHVGLFIEVKISKAKDVEDIWTKIKEGVLNSFSIGGRFKKVQVERDEEGRITSFKILEIELFEVSVVGIPANPKANITDVIEKRFKPLLKRENKMKKSEKKVEEKEVEKVEDKAPEVKGEEKVEGITAEKAQEMINEALKPVAETLKTVAETMAKLVEAKETKSEDKTEEKAGVPDWAKKIQDDLAALNQKIKTPSRKGLSVETDEQEENEEVEEVEENKNPEKCLDPQNENCATFVKWAMDNPEDGYNKLSDGEKKKCDSLYFSLMQNSKNVRKK